MFYSHYFDLNYLVKEHYPTTAWYLHENKQKLDEYPEIPNDEYAFYVNLDAAIREMLDAGAKVLLFQEREKSNFKIFNVLKESKVIRNDSVLKTLAEKYNLEFVPFPKNFISEDDWLDSVHLKPSGIIKKSEYLVDYVMKAFKK